jgi:hypothetical protein
MSQTSQNAARGENENFLTRARYRFGRWLLRPKSVQIVNHYRDAMSRNEINGRHREAEHCQYIVIGADYIGWKRQHG